MDQHIQRADHRLRRVTAIVIVLALLAAIIAVVVVRNWMIGRALASTPEQFVVQMRMWIGFVALGCAACLVALTVYAWQKARRAGIEQRWPLERARLLFDTPIRRGPAVAGIVRLLRLVAVITLVFAIGTLALGTRLLMRAM